MKRSFGYRPKVVFTGIPCTHGHVANRSTGNRVCFECQKLRLGNFRDNNQNYHHEYNKQYYPNNRERTSDLSNAYYARKPPNLLIH